MLQKLNERIQGLVAWIVILLIAVTFTLFGVDYYMQSRQLSDTKVTVNDEVISNRAFDIQYRRARYQHDLSKMTPALDQSLKQQVLDKMITHAVLVQAAEKAGYDITTQQANATILNIPQFQQDGQFSEERFQQAISGALYTVDSFQKEVRQGMLLNQLRFSFMGTTFALPSEVERFVNLYLQQRDYDYVLIPAKAYAGAAHITDAEIEAYYQAHPSEFVEPEQVSIDYIRLSMPDVKRKIHISDEDVATYYEEYRNNFLTPARWKVSHILFSVPKDADTETRERIKAKAEKAYKTLEADPKAFEQILSTQSDDKLSLAQKGELPWISAGQGEYDNYLTGLKTPGQVTPPVSTSLGYEIFKLVGYTPAKEKSLADVKSQIIEQFKLEKAQTEFASLMEQLGDLSYQTPDSLNPVASALDLSLERSKRFTRKGSADGVSQNADVVKAAFSHDVLELGNNSEPIQLDNDTVIVLRVHQRFAQQQKALEAVSTEIKSKLSHDKVVALAAKAGRDALDAQDSAKAVAELNQTHHLTWKAVSGATRENTTASADINELAFSIGQNKAYTGASLPSGDYAIVQLKQIREGNYAAMDREQKAAIAQQIESNQGIMVFDLYVNQLMKQAKIVRTEEQAVTP